MKPTHVKSIILQASPTCNLNCSYCYIPENQRKKRTIIELDVIKKIFSKIFPSQVFTKYLNINWHAGEPFIVPIDYYKEILNIINGAIQKELKRQNGQK